jgi:hypothetical protein
MPSLTRLYQLRYAEILPTTVAGLGRRETVALIRARGESVVRCPDRHCDNGAIAPIGRADMTRPKPIRRARHGQ